MSPYSGVKSLVEELEEQVEYWRQRAEAAEAALHGSEWDVAVHPLTLTQTRIMRLLARQDLTADRITDGLGRHMRTPSPRSVIVHICKIRTLLPAHLAPPLLRTHGTGYTIPDRAALRQWLESGSNNARAREGNSPIRRVA